MRSSRVMYLLAMTGLMLFTMLGAREIWTQEHRWADIVYGMFYHNDFFHPSLDGNEYYDKPLLSYWLIAGFTLVTGKLSAWALRLPSALAGLLAVWSIYRLGTKLKNRELGLLAGWLLLTTFYFIFWARTSSADMLNMAGTLFAVTWYFEKKTAARWIDYVIFFLILAITALCKGLVAPVVAMIAIFPDLVMEKSWKKYFNIPFVLSMLPAAVVYALPFWASTHFGHADYSENGMYLVYRENILRYFQPFDHQGPLYTYFLFLPVYLLPWTFFFIPALISLKSRWQTMSQQSKWLVWVVGLLFLFFTLSGSRRNYYILPVVPFALLLTADWIVENAKPRLIAGWFAIVFYVALFCYFGIFQPLYYLKTGTERFAVYFKQEVGRIKPGSHWNIILLDPESKIRFYLELPPDMKNYDVSGERNTQTVASLMTAWPILKKNPPNTIYITRRSYVPLLQTMLPRYRLIDLPSSRSADFPVAFMPE